MTNEIKGPGDGSTFERELDALASAYRASAHDEPPAALDDAIRAAARRAVHARPQSLRKSWYSRFSGPLAVAAVMVLTVSITMVSVIEQPELVPTPVQKALAPRSAAPKAQEETRLAESRSAALLEKRRSDAPRAAQDKFSSDSMRQAARATPAAVQPVPEAPAPAVAGSIAARRDPAPFVADPALKIEVKREASTPPAKDLADLSAAEAPPKTAAAMPSPAATRPAPPAVESAAAAKSMIAVPAAPAAPAAMNAPAETERSRANAIAAQPQASARKKQDASNVREIAAEPAGAPAESPAQWLKRIVELRKEGKTKEAEEELARFRKRYPDHRLPAEFKSGR